MSTATPARRDVVAVNVAADSPQTIAAALGGQVITISRLSRSLNPCPSGATVRLDPRVLNFIVGLLPATGASS